MAPPCAERSAGHTVRSPGRSPAALPITAVVLPGAGSDEQFVRRAFARPLRALGIDLVAPAPAPGRDLVSGYRAALDGACDSAHDSAPGGLLVGGISLGAHVAAGWAREQRPDRLSGLLLALPAWTGRAETGRADGAPAAQAARATADLVRTAGLQGAVDVARAGSPPWLATELERAWRRYGPGLAASLDAAAQEPAPDADALRSLAVPTGIAALVDDPVHPLVEARRWTALVPGAVLHTATLAAFGADPEVIGRAAVLGWLRSRVSPAGGGDPSEGGS